VLLGLFAWLAGINTILAVSNLIPAFPLDGGRILRAVLWRHTGRRIRATHLAALWGQILAAVIALLSVWLIFAVAVWSGMWILALSLFLFVAARSEWSSSRPAPELLDMPVGQMRRQLPMALGPTATVADVQAAFDAHPAAPFVPLTGRRNSTESMVTRDAVARIPPAQHPVVPATSLAEPLLGLPRVDPTESVGSVVARLGQGQNWWALMTDRDGHLGALMSTDVAGVLEVVTGE
jgi:hypothetical protein